MTETLQSQSEYPFTFVVNDKTYNCKEVPVKGESYSKMVTSNDEVAILYSPGYGAGWSTWRREHSELLTRDSRIVKFVLHPDFRDRFKRMDFDKSLKEEYKNFMIDVVGFSPDQVPYDGGFHKLTVSFVPSGTLYRIEEYDGAESIEIYDPGSYYTA